MAYFSFASPNSSLNKRLTSSCLSYSSPNLYLQEDPAQPLQDPEEICLTDVESDLEEEDEEDQDLQTDQDKAGNEGDLQGALVEETNDGHSQKPDECEEGLAAPIENVNMEECPSPTFSELQRLQCELFDESQPDPLQNEPLQDDFPLSQAPPIEEEIEILDTPEKEKEENQDESETVQTMSSHRKSLEDQISEVAARLRNAKKLRASQTFANLLSQHFFDFQKICEKIQIKNKKIDR